MTTTIEINDKVTYKGEEHIVKSIRKDFRTKKMLLRLVSPEGAITGNDIPIERVEKGQPKVKRTRKKKESKELSRYEMVKSAVKEVSQSKKYKEEDFVDLVAEMADKTEFTALLDNMTEDEVSDLIEEIKNKVK